MPRGGKRPGAAPKGNMNALKHGRRSRQFADLGALIAQSPTARDALLAIAGRWEMEKGKADYVAGRIPFSIMKRSLIERAGRLTVPPPDADGRSIVGSAPYQPSSNPGDSRNSSEIPPDNHKRSATNRKNPID